MLGTTVTGDVVVAFKFMRDGDVTKLRHILLGHMSENDMTELSRRGFLDHHSTSKLKLSLTTYTLIFGYHADCLITEMLIIY